MDGITFPCIIRYVKNEAPEMLYCKDQEDFMRELDSIISVGNNVESFAVFTIAINKAKIYTWEDV